MTKREISKYFGANSHSEGLPTILVLHLNIQMPTSFVNLTYFSSFALLFHQMTLLFCFVSSSLLSSLVPEYEVISPFQADETGTFLSHKLNKRSRTKRSLDQPNNWFYNVEAFGFTLHLNVTKSRHILAPGTIVETVDENGSKSYTTPPKNTLYSGHVVSHPGSVVAVSNHDGLVCICRLP